MTGTSPPRRLPATTLATLLAAALVAWVVLVARMRGMDAGPGTDLGSLGWYLGIWVTMTAAMMLPSAAPMVWLFATLSRGIRTWIFVGGYVAAWTAYGLVAYGLFRLVTSLGAGWLGWDRAGPYAAAGAIAAAGIYQLTPLKALCLHHCRSPLHFVMRSWRGGPPGALRMGLVHGLYCVGCCSGLMVILFALGLMSIVWMALVAALVFAEKVLPYGYRLARPIALALLALAIWLASAPASVPGLTQPGTGMDPGSSPAGADEALTGPQHGSDAGSSRSARRLRTTAEAVRTVRRLRLRGRARGCRRSSDSSICRRTSTAATGTVSTLNLLSTLAEPIQ